MEAEKGKRMNKARMQMDWLRYWTLQAKNERSTKAPADQADQVHQGLRGPERPEVTPTGLG